MKRGVWWATVHGVARSQTQLRNKYSHLCDWTLMAVFPCHHTSQGQTIALRVWVSYRHTWAGAPYLLELSSLSTGWCWLGPLLLQPYSPACEWMTLGHGPGFRVLSFLFYQETSLLYTWLPRFSQREQNPAGNTMIQEYHGCLLLKLHISTAGIAGSIPGQGSKIPGWQKWQRTDSLTVWKTLKIARPL